MYVVYKRHLTFCIRGCLENVCIVKFFLMHNTMHNKHEKSGSFAFMCCHITMDSNKHNNIILTQK
jgi:hypothetical protein